MADRGRELWSKQKSNADQFRALTAKARASARAARQPQEEGPSSAGAEDSVVFPRTELVSPRLSSQEVSMAETEGDAANPLLGSDTGSTFLTAVKADVPAPRLEPITPASASPVAPSESQAPASPPASRRSARTRTVAFADLPTPAAAVAEPTTARSSPPSPVNGDTSDEDSDSVDEEGQLKMPRPSQRVREEEELWKRRRAKMEAEAGRGEEASESEEELVPLGEMDSGGTDEEEEL